MSFRAWKRGFRIVEIPIVFVDRTEGQSKMSKSIVREAVWMVWRLALVVADDGADLTALREAMIPAGRAFFKMSGSGNDFVMVDARTEPPRHGSPSRTVSASLCARGTGVGADGIVFLEPSESADVKLTYLNADGSPADLCGNATLCTTRLAVELGHGGRSGHAHRDRVAESFAARIRPTGRRRSIFRRSSMSGRHRGYSEPRRERTADRLRRWSAFRTSSFCARRFDRRRGGPGPAAAIHPTLRPHGANVNFVSPGLPSG